jgi:hypothetical protein
MATWEARRVCDVVHDIHDGRIVLPVIQRSLVWNEPKIELLYDSLLRGNSFGGIMVLQEESGNQPLFAFRSFSREGEETVSKEQEQLAQKTHLVIDGQQRLQSFYMGLRGGINGKRLYLNLLGDGDEYEFRFAFQAADLPVKEPGDDGAPQRKLWYAVPALFSRSQRVHDPRQVANEIAAEDGITDGAVKDILENNVYAFFLSVFVWQAIGLSSVSVNKSQADIERRRIVELFRRLNDGGTRLSSFDLAASMYKGFDYRMEGFFREVRQFGDMGIGQDEVIKLVFLLQDSHAKEVTDIEAGDAEFVIENQERILVTLHVLRKFLKQAALYEYYRSGGRSVIPLYFIAYHIFHKDVPTARLGQVYDDYDVHPDDFMSVKRWVYLSALNGVFSRGVGWIPYRTGIRKILNTLRQYKGAVFPAEALFAVYRGHPLRFSVDVTPERLDRWAADFVFHLIYEGQALSGRDVDHVHPKSRLESAKVEPFKIHSIANYQLLDEGTNRNEKRAKSLAEWLHGKSARDLNIYLERHLIPPDESLWQIDQFDAFLQKRAVAIVDKIRSSIPEPVAPPPPPPPPPPESGPSVLSLEELGDKLTPEQRQHPILKDTTTWHQIFKTSSCGPRWTGTYRKALGSQGIVTVADLALAVMALKLEFRFKATHGNVYQFHDPLPDGKINLETRSFGGWAWSVALSNLERRGLDWRQYLVEPVSKVQEDKAKAPLREALRAQLTPEQRGHPILENDATWHDFFSARVNPVWTGRYRNELLSAGIVTVADLALFIMALGLEFLYSYEWGNVFRFARPAPDGNKIELATKSFGGWAWSTALAGLKSRGFDWQTYVVNPQDLREKGKQ